MFCPSCNISSLNRENRPSIATLHFSLFTFLSSLFTFHSSHFTLHSSLFTFHSSLFTFEACTFDFPSISPEIHFPPSVFHPANAYGVYPAGNRSIRNLFSENRHING